MFDCCADGCGAVSTDEAVIEEPAANTTHPECAAIVAQDGGTILCRKCSYCRRQDCKTIVY